MKHRVFLCWLAATFVLDIGNGEICAEQKSRQATNRPYLGNVITSAVATSETGDNLMAGTTGRVMGLCTKNATSQTAVCTGMRSTHVNALAAIPKRKDRSNPFSGVANMYGIGLAVSGANAELRFPVVWRFRGVVKLDFGKVWSALKHFDFDLHRWVVKPAATLRFDTEMFAARADLGLGKEKTSLYFSFRHVF